ncbi:MAG: NADH-quinone oxidoreductase subunit A [Planctomycetota bacterium]|nr:NADH-quinone oxidoreductase subunit A [Planctomycetota bacterium]MDA1213610.1 NADH-quinone oxidoreductase subunit A [Planctomycetota bacterium]
MTDLVGHFLLFTLVVIGFLIVPLLLGKLLRPNLPTAEKEAIYECGEPTIGSSYIQYDLRYYVVALLFIIFDVEVAFFFPWAMVYGGATQLADSRLDSAARTEISARLLNTDAANLTSENIIGPDVALQLGWLGFADLLVFFAVLLVGFAYVWNRGDLDWVKAVADKARQQAAQRVLARQSAFETPSTQKMGSTVA